MDSATATTDPAVVEEHRGRFGYGLGQALGLWLTVLLLMAFARHAAFVWGCFGTGLLANILLGKWHRRRGRADSAVGAFSGVILWPLIIAAVIIAIGIVAEYQSEYE